MERERTFYTVNVHFNIDNVIIYYSRRRRRLHYYQLADDSYRR